MSTEAVLDFKNPVFHPGLNVTVRAGRQYMDHASIKPGQAVRLTCTERGCECGSALIVSTQYFETLDTVPQALLQFEHMPSCREDKDELQRLLTQYCGEDYGPGVTLVFFYYPFSLESSTST